MSRRSKIHPKGRERFFLSPERFSEEGLEKLKRPLTWEELHQIMGNDDFARNSIIDAEIRGKARWDAINHTWQRC